MISNYRQGKRYGPAKYIWADGSVEVSIYDQDGVQNGPAKLTWPNGAVREGNKVSMMICGEIFNRDYYLKYQTHKQLKKNKGIDKMISFAFS